jgi:hypothetical protein
LRYDFQIVPAHHTPADAPLQISEDIFPFIRTKDFKRVAEDRQSLNVNVSYSIWRKTYCRMPP